MEPVKKLQEFLAKEKIVLQPTLQWVARDDGTWSTRVALDVREQPEPLPEPEIIPEEIPPEVAAP